MRPANPGLVLAVDPGRKPGFAYLLPGGTLATFRDPAAAVLRPDTLVVERPVLRMRREKRARISPVGIVTLGISAGLLAGALGERFGLSPVWVEPATWKGQVEKSVMLRRIRAAFPDVVATDDEIDALGLAAWTHGRDWLRSFG